MSVSVIVPTIGRPTLTQTIASVSSQLGPDDEIVVEVDLPMTKDDGNRARDAAVSRAKGTHLWFIDDDDAAEPGALAVIRDAISEDPDCCWVFKMKIAGLVFWQAQKIGSGNTGTPTMVVPRIGCPQWSGEPHYTEYHFAEKVNGKFGMKWREDIIASVRPHTTRKEVSNA